MEELREEGWILWTLMKNSITLEYNQHWIQHCQNHIGLTHSDSKESKNSASENIREFIA